MGVGEHHCCRGSSSHLPVAVGACRARGPSVCKIWTISSLQALVWICCLPLVRHCRLCRSGSLLGTPSSNLMLFPLVSYTIIHVTAALQMCHTPRSCCKCSLKMYTAFPIFKILIEELASLYVGWCSLPHAHMSEQTHIDEPGFFSLLCGAALMFLPAAPMRDLSKKSLI